MDVGELWEAVEITSKICSVIDSLRCDVTYMREDAVKDLEKVLIQHMEPTFATVFMKDPHNEEYPAIEEEKKRMEGTT
jgi:hypothetical protein